MGRTGDGAAGTSGAGWDWPAAGLGRGEVWRGWWEGGAGSVPPLPVLAARGGQDGPTLVVTGGVHGDEYEGPAAIQALFRGLDAARLRGTLLGVPVVNVAAWEARSRVTPTDGVNLNRVFPGRRPTGVDGPSLLLAEALFEGIVRRCDIVIDLHSGGVALDHLPLIGWYAGGDGRAERLARGFDAALHPWLMPDVPGVLSCEAHRAGKVALGAEWHGGGRLDGTGARAYLAGLRRVLANTGMLDQDGDGAPDEAPLDPRPPISGNYQETPVGGLFTPRVALGERVAAGALLGVLHDPLGNVVAPVEAARAGTVACLPHVALLHAGDRVAYIG